MSFLLGNWKIITILSMLAIMFGAGWYIHGLYYTAHLQKNTETALKNVGKGATDIIKFNQEYQDAQGNDDCAGKPMPIKLRQLLK